MEPKKTTAIEIQITDTKDIIREEFAKMTEALLAKLEARFVAGQVAPGTAHESS